MRAEFYQCLALRIGVKSSCWSLVFVLCLGIIPMGTKHGQVPPAPVISSVPDSPAPVPSCLSPVLQGRCSVSVCAALWVSPGCLAGCWAPPGSAGCCGAAPERDNCIRRNPLQLPQINYSLIITHTLWIREQGWQGVDGRWSNLDCN